jgi:hypothetical protein
LETEEKILRNLFSAGGNIVLEAEQLAGSQLLDEILNHLNSPAAPNNGVIRSTSIIARTRADILGCRSKMITLSSSRAFDALGPLPPEDRRTFNCVIPRRILQRY